MRFTSESVFTLGVPRILEVERAIRQSRYTLLVISEAYLANNQTLSIIDILAQSYGEQVGTWPVIPLTLQQGLQFPLRSRMLEELKASDSKQWRSAIERLCYQLKRTHDYSEPKEFVESQQPQFSNLYELIQNCTVRAEVQGKRGYSTGFFVAPGIILTCSYIVKEVENKLIDVVWQNQTYSAEILQLADPQV